MNTNSEPDFSKLAQPFIHYSRCYVDNIKSSLISVENLRALYRILALKATEAADKEIAISPNLPEPVKEVFKNLKDKLWVEIWGENNEYISGDHESIFDDARLPKKIIRIFFNSYNGYQVASQSKMHNWIELQFDFKKTNIFDFSKITDPANQNTSYFKVQGTDETWVDGVYQAINSFLKDKSRKRNWLYSNYTYDALLYLIFFPLIFRVAYKIGAFLNISDLIVPLSVAIYIYIFIICLYLFRTLFNYTKWVFPLVELENEKSNGHRPALGVIILSIIASAIYEIGKMLTGTLS